MRTAILVDGAFFLRRFRSCFPHHDAHDAKSVAYGLRLLAESHVAKTIDPEVLQANTYAATPTLLESKSFYRLFFYDCPPLEKRMHTPLEGKAIDFGKSPQAIFRKALHLEVKNLRKVALRLGRLNEASKWRLSERATSRLIEDPEGFVPLDSDFDIDTKQKGVDMRLGIDVASLAFKKQVDQIVIVAADADFVPAAKLARREGIDVVLDRMLDKTAAKDLIHHVDGVRDSYFTSAIQ
jgi:uncharacterized protein (TIGR00288 family)